MRSIDLFRASKGKSSLPVADSESNSSQRVILAVISSSQVQIAVEQSLDTVFIELIFVGSGEAAVEYLNKNSVSLVISEINLPMMNGLNLSRRIKENESLRDIPVLLISDSNEGPDRVLGMETGADDYVTLPINPSELRSRVMALTSRRDANRAENQHLSESKEIFNDGILGSEQKAGVESIPEDEIGLGESTKNAPEIAKYEPDSSEAMSEPVQESDRKPIEETEPTTGTEPLSTEEMLNPSLASETPSSTPVMPDEVQPGTDSDVTDSINKLDDSQIPESVEESSKEENLHENDLNQIESKPDIINTDESASMLDEIFGGASAKEELPQTSGTEVREAIVEPDTQPSEPPPVEGDKFSSEPIDNRQPPLQTEQNIPQAPLEEILPPAAFPQMTEPVQQPPEIPATSVVGDKSETVVPADAVQAATTNETPIEPPVIPADTTKPAEPAPDENSEIFNEYKIDSADDNKEIYQSAITHLKELEEAVIGGYDYNYTNLVRDPSKIVASVRQSNYLQIRAMGKRDGSDFPVHSLNVTVYSVKLATGLKYETKKLIELAMAALLHDVGMLLIPEDIRHAQRRLTPEEISTLKNHPQYGSDFLTKAVQTHSELAPFTFLPIVALQEHERMNGTGYPNSLPGDEIHEYAKIVSIIDMYEPVSHTANYRDEYLAYEALQKVVALKDTHFDVKLLRALVREISIFPIDSIIKLNDGQIGRVIGLEPSHPMRPKLLLLYDAEGNKYEEEKEIELSKSPFLYVETPIPEDEFEKLPN